jgi:glycosyltransferase involved in cell wall biosynthesis
MTEQKQKKILMIIGLFYPCIGGAEQECQKIAKKLAEEGHQISILTQYRDGLAASDVVDGIPVYRKIKGWHLYELTYMLSVFILLLRYRRSFDVIICFGLYLFVAPAVIFSRLAGKKIIVRLESGGDTGDLLHAARLRNGSFVLACARRADFLIALSDQIKQELQERGFPRKRILRISNSVDTALFCPAPHTPHNSPPIISYIGRLKKEKGVEVLLQALHRLQGTTPRLQAVIVGDGEQRTCLQALAVEYKLSDQVTFTGELPGASSVIPYYQQSQAIVMPSYSEGMPLVLLEAMACGVPVIASRVGGIPDVLGMPLTIEPEAGGYWLAESGLLVDPGDAEALSAAVLRLVTDNGLRQALARKGRENAAAYSLERVVEQYQQLFSAADG